MRLDDEAVESVCDDAVVQLPKSVVILALAMATGAVEFDEQSARMVRATMRYALARLGAASASKTADEQLLRCQRRGSTAMDAEQLAAARKKASEFTSIVELAYTDVSDLGADINGLMQSIKTAINDEHRERTSRKHEPVGDGSQGMAVAIDELKASAGFDKDGTAAQGVSGALDMAKCAEQFAAMSKASTRFRSDGASVNGASVEDATKAANDLATAAKSQQDVARAASAPDVSGSTVAGTTQNYTIDGHSFACKATTLSGNRIRFSGCGMSIFEHVNESLDKREPVTIVRLHDDGVDRWVGVICATSSNPRANTCDFEVERVVSPLGDRLAKIIAMQAPLRAHYISWTQPLREPPVIRWSPSGVAIEMSLDQTRGKSGQCLIGFPDADRVEWVECDVVHSWPIAGHTPRAYPMHGSENAWSLDAGKRQSAAES